MVLKWTGGISKSDVCGIFKAGVFCFDAVTGQSSTHTQKSHM